MSWRFLVVAGLLMGLSGCAGTPPEANMEAALPPLGASEAPPDEDGMVVEAIRVVPHVYPVQVVGHIKPSPCVGLGGCDFGVSVERPDQQGTLSAGLQWTRFEQAHTDAEGLFWRIRLVGNWTSSTPTVDSVELAVATIPSGCASCEPRVAYRESFAGPGLIDVRQTDIFLEDGEDTLVYWVEPTAVGPAAMRPADDVKVELRGWTAAYVAAGEPIRLS